MKVNVQNGSSVYAGINVNNNIQNVKISEYLTALSSARLDVIKQVFPLVNYNQMVNVKSGPSNQWELNLPYATYNMDGKVKVSKGDYSSRDKVSSTIDAGALRVYEVSTDMTKNITELNNMDKFGLSFAQDDMQLGFQLLLQEVQRIVELGVGKQGNGEFGIFNIDKTKYPIRVLESQKNILDYDFTNLTDIEGLIQWLNEIIQQVYVDSKQMFMVDTIALPLKFRIKMTAFFNIPNANGVPSLGTVEDIVKSKLNVNIVYGNKADTDVLLVYVKDAIEMFDVMRLRAVTEMTQSINGQLDYVAYIQGSQVNVPLVTRITPIAIRQPKAVTLVKMNAHK